MNASKLMALFHLSFMLLSIGALFLMAVEIIAYDWLALWIIVLAVALNAFFAVMWYDETSKIRVQKQDLVTVISHEFPMVSFVVPAHNQEQQISSCVKSLFNCASNYRGPSEIIIIDDGSTDATYESAWSAIDMLQKELPQIHVRILKHMTHLGREEAAKTGANKAMGEYIALLDATTPCDCISLNQLIDTMSTTQKTVVSHEVRLPSYKDEPAVTRSLLLYPADVLRRMLHEEQTVKSTKETKF